MPGHKATAAEVRREALDEWAAFTLHGSEAFDWSIFQAVASQVVQRFCLEVSQVIAHPRTLWSIVTPSDSW